MKAPDKIYIPAEWMNVPKNFFETKESIGATEYIRKDALLEWAKDYLDQRIYDDKREVMKELIEKINSL